MPDVNITSHGQQSGITAHTVTIAQGAPPPPAAPPRKPWWNTTWAIVVGMVTFLAAVVAVLGYFGIGPREIHMAKDGTINVTSINQQGGITAHTVNVGQQPRSLQSPGADALKAQILRDVPRDKTITVMALMGDADGHRFAAEIYEFLKANGFKVTPHGVAQGVVMPPPKGLLLQPRGDELEFIVGSAN
jgi:hypothetical protein